MLSLLFGSKTLSIGEFTQAIYEELFRGKSQTLKFGDEIHQIVHRDWDGVKAGEGGLSYYEGKIVSLETEFSEITQDWTISRGQSWMNAYSRDFDSDIIAVPTANYRKIRAQKAFQSSPMVGTTHEGICIPRDGRFGEILRKKFSEIEYVKEIQYYGNFLDSLVLNPNLESKEGYSKKLIEPLVRVIENTLIEVSKQPDSR